MKTLEPRTRLMDKVGRTSGESLKAPTADARGFRLHVSDYCFLTGVALIPFISPKPGPFDPTPGGWTDRVAICDGFLVLTMLLIASQWLTSAMQRWFRSGTVRHFTLVGPALKKPLSSVWPMPPISPVWYATFMLLAVIVLSWMANPMRPINPRMVAALAVQVYLAVVGLLLASAVCRYGSPKPVLVAWTFGFALLAIICLYDAAAMMTGRHMLYPGAEDRLRGPFRTSAQLAAYSLTSFFLMMAAARLMSERVWFSRFATTLAILAPVFVILASRRSAVAALGTGFLTLLVVSKHRTQILIGTAMPMVIAIIALLVFAPGNMEEYFMQRVRPLIGQDPDRVDIAFDHFGRGLAAFKENPILGVGFGGFSETRFGEISDTISHEQHSGYLAILAETGAVGFSVLLGLHLVVLVILIRLWNCGVPQYKELAGFLLVLMIALGTSEVYNRIWRERALWVVVGMIAALTSVAARHLRQFPPPLAKDAQPSSNGRVGQQAT